MIKFFCNNIPLKADISRHRKQEAELVAKIEQLEAEGDTRFLSTYRNFLCQLRQSKAEVVSKIGRK